MPRFARDADLVSSTGAALHASIVEDLVDLPVLEMFRDETAELRQLVEGDPDAFPEGALAAVDAFVADQVERIEAFLADQAPPDQGDPPAIRRELVTARAGDLVELGEKVEGVLSGFAARRAELLDRRLEIEGDDNFPAQVLPDVDEVLDEQLARVQDFRDTIT